MRRILPLAVLTLLLAGCADKEMSDLKNYVDEVNARPPSGISPPPEVVQIDTFEYLAMNRREPFTPMRSDEESAEELTDTGLRPDFNRRKEELEYFSLDSLRMVGTLEQEGESWGLVQTKEGTIHRVAPGQYMGMNHGKITQISDEEIALIELIQSGTGYIEREAALALGEE